VSEAVARLLSTQPEPAPGAKDLGAAAAELAAKVGSDVHASSITPSGERLYFLTRERRKRLGVVRQRTEA